ncbi:MAG TPA: hypothetical protein VND45_07075 [Thermoanaerobaculia bacterium]|jgi:hypothetical protein|nr:hypothetical protein [Thermoanaerobaculia bacterium]
MRHRLLLAVVLLLPFVAEARERAVLIYPRERSWFRRVFYTPHQKELLARMSSTYDIHIHQQVSDKRELFDIDVDGAQLLVLSAHGDPFSMYFGNRRSRTLETSDRARLAAFFDRLDPFATIVLQSCHTGRGFAHVVKEAAGPTRRVIAARGEVPPDGLRITSIAPFDAAIVCDDGGRRWDCTVRLR